MHCQNNVSLQISHRHVAIVFSSDSDSSESDNAFGGFDTRGVQRAGNTHQSQIMGSYFNIEVMGQQVLLRYLGDREKSFHGNFWLQHCCDLIDKCVVYGNSFSGKNYFVFTLALDERKYMERTSYENQNEN